MTQSSASARSLPTRKIAGRTIRRWLVDFTLLTAIVTSVLFEPLSIAIHSIVGLVFMALAGPHLWDRRRWISVTLSQLRRRRKLPSPRGWKLAQASLLLVLVAAVTLSGLWDWLGVPTKIRYHAITGVILIVIAARHTWSRRRSLVRWRRRRPERRIVAGVKDSPRGGPEHVGGAAEPGRS